MSHSITKSCNIKANRFLVKTHMLIKRRFVTKIAPSLALPYYLFSVLEPGDRKKKIGEVKTKVKKKTINPHYDEEFSINVKPGQNHILFEGNKNSLSPVNLTPHPLSVWQQKVQRWQLFGSVRAANRGDAAGTEARFAAKSGREGLRVEVWVITRILGRIVTGFFSF